VPGDFPALRGLAPPEPARTNALLPAPPAGRCCDEATGAAAAATARGGEGASTHRASDDADSAEDGVTMSCAARTGPEPPVRPSALLAALVVERGVM
jgi:hypothetical protein